MENRVISVGHLEQVYENKMKFPCADIYRKNKLCIDPKVAKHATRRALPNVSYCETFGVCVLYLFSSALPAAVLLTVRKLRRGA